MREIKVRPAVLKRSFMLGERPAKGRSMASCHRSIRASVHSKAGLGPKKSIRELIH